MWALTILAVLIMVLADRPQRPQGDRGHPEGERRQPDRRAKRCPRLSRSAATCCWWSATSSAASMSPSSAAICRPTSPTRASACRCSASTSRRLSWAAGRSAWSVCSTSPAPSCGAPWATGSSARTCCRLLYLLRSLVFLGFVLAPLSAASVLIFAAALGFLWLGTVPLTTSLVGYIFGPVHRHHAERLRLHRATRSAASSAAGAAGACSTCRATTT